MLIETSFNATNMTSRSSYSPDQVCQRPSPDMNYVVHSFFGFII